MLLPGSIFLIISPVTDVLYRPDMAVQRRQQSIRKVNIACQRRGIRPVAPAIDIEPRIVIRLPLRGSLPLQRPVFDRGF